MTPARLAWLLCGWATFLLFQGAVNQLARARAEKLQATLLQEDVEAFSRGAYQVALERLRSDPYWQGDLPQLTREDMKATMKVINFVSSERPGYEGATWVPPHSVILKGTVSHGGQKQGDPPIRFESLAEFAPPTFSQAVTLTDPGPFTSPLPAAPTSASGRHGADGPLLAGAYDQVTIAAGVRARLEPSASGSRVYRFRTLWLERGAQLEVPSYPENPAVIYIGEALMMAGQNTANWTPENKPGNSARLQIYLLPGTGMWVRDSKKLSLVAAGPNIDLSNSELHGALAGGRVTLAQSQVLYEEKLSGVALQGLGPLRLRGAPF